MSMKCHGVLIVEGWLPYKTESLESAQSLLHVCTAQTHPAQQFVRWIVSTRPSKGSCCIRKTCALAVDIVSMRAHLVRHNTLRQAITDPGVKWTNVRSVPAVLKRTCLSPNSKNMGVTAWQRANCRCVRKCARPRHSSQGMVTPFQTFSGSALLLVDLDQVLGDGVQHTLSRASTSA